MHRILRFSLCLLFAALCCNPIYAVQPDINQLALVIMQKQSTPESNHRAIEAGRERALLCSVCHGKAGNSAKPEVPNLAGQNPVYLLDQIEKFADGRRKNYVMNSLSKNLSRDDRINLAIFYNSMSLKPIAIDAQLASQGKPLYEEHCISCHGVTGAGSASFARIGGQQPRYVLDTLKQFRDNANTDTTVKSSRRRSEIMEPIVRHLSDKQLEAITAYLAQLR